MKANEPIMIGDWIYAIEIEQQTGREIQHLIKIDAINTWGIEDISGIERDFLSIEGIPLTAEILEKNGFRYNDLPFVQGWEQFGLTLYHGGNGYLINCGQNVAMKINAVHQLQHALHLCEIEHEIIL